jgi:hypothetical protein
MHGYQPTVRAWRRSQLTTAGCKKVFRETASGAKTDRTQLRKALEQIDAGDVLMVTRLDRLARSTRDLLNILATVADRKAGFRSLGDTWADTTSPYAQLPGPIQYVLPPALAHLDDQPEFSVRLRATPAAVEHPLRRHA